MEHHHHYHRDPEKQKREIKIKNYATALLILALIILIPYLAIEFFPFVRSIQAHNKINFSTMCYTFLSIMFVLTPLAIVVPSKPYKHFIEKINLLSKMFSLISFFFFCGLVADIMSYNIFGGYIDTGRDPIMIKMLFGCVDISGLVFCFIQGVFYLFLSKMIKGHKKDVIIVLAGTYATYLILPFLGMLIKNVPFFTKDWYTWFNKNVYLWLSNMFILAGLAVAAKSRYVWSKLLWK